MTKRLKKKMAWEVEGADEGIIGGFYAIAESISIAENAHRTTAKIVDTGLVSADEKTTTFTFNALDAPVLTAALNLVGFFSEALREPTKDLALRLMDAARLVPGEDPDFDDRLAKAREKVYREELLDAMRTLGLSTEEAEAEASALSESGLLSEAVGDAGSKPHLH